jgi:sirohydrochlorin ferrochelatase
MPVFLLVTDVRPVEPSWVKLQGLATSLQVALTRSLALPVRVELAGLPDAGSVLERAVADGVAEAFVLPALFEFHLHQRTALGEELGMVRRRHPATAIHHDVPDPADPLLRDAVVAGLHVRLRERKLRPSSCGLILAASGQGDSSNRAESYRLMRLLWEQAGVARASVGFVRNETPFLRAALEDASAHDLTWFLLPQSQWRGDLTDYAGVILSDFQRSHANVEGWELLDPIEEHPMAVAWLEQRALRLWRDKRAREAARVPSARTRSAEFQPGFWSGTDWRPAAKNKPPKTGFIGRARDASSLGEVLRTVLPKSDQYLVKVTWHGYAQGTYIGPSALDLLLGALPGKAMLLEGHTSRKNVEEREIDWENGAREHRAWIRDQEMEFLRRTGIAEVMARHKAQYLNVTEAWWDEACAPAGDVRAAIGDVALKREELTGFIPSILMNLRGTPMISFARFKGPMRLSLSNLFGLIPHPLRLEWHGPSVQYFANVCCDLAAIYGGLFPLYGLDEAFESAVRWNRKGLYRTRWGNYDLVMTDGLFTFSQGLAGADILAARLQGQDVTRSGFYGAVRRRLGWPELVDAPLPEDVHALLA